MLVRTDTVVIAYRDIQEVRVDNTLGYFPDVHPANIYITRRVERLSSHNIHEIDVLQASFMFCFATHTGQHFMV